MRFESLWIQVSPLVLVSRSLSLFSPFLKFKEVFQMIFLLWFLIADWFLLTASPPYSSFLGFLMYHWFPPFAALGTRTNVVLATLVTGLFLIFSLFSPFEVPPPPKSSQLTFLFWKVLRADFQSSLPKTSRCSFSDPPFWLLHLLSFSLNGQIPPY